MGKPPLNRRRARFRRSIEDMIRSPDGKVSEAKVFALAGKATCLYLILAYTKEVLNTEYTLLTLLSFVIAPELVKAFMRMKLAAPAK